MIAELRTLVAVVRHRTFSAAADHIGLTQAAVSGHIRRLEQHLGFELFDRHGRTVMINAAGLRTLERARHMLERFDTLGDPDDPTAGMVVKMGAIASVQSALLAAPLARFHAALPHCRVQVVPGLSLHLLDQVDAGELDLAVMTRPPYGLPGELDWKTIGIEPYVLVAPQVCAGHDWRDVLRAEPCLRYDRLAFGGRHVDRFLRGLPFPVREVMEVPVQAMVTMVAQGLGVALVPESLMRDACPPQVCRIALDGVDLRREIGVLVSRRKADEPTIARLIACLAMA